jgi:hypothetical protein
VKEQMNISMVQNRNLINELIGTESLTKIKGNTMEQRESFEKMVPEKNWISSGKIVDSHIILHKTIQNVSQT